MKVEEELLEEMSIRVISSQNDNLPFKIVIKCPDKGDRDHAHIIKLKTKSEEVGAFVITNNPPKSVKDLVGYTDGSHEGLGNIDLDGLQAIVYWANRKNSFLSKYTNWQTLQYEYAVNRNS